MKCKFFVLLVLFSEGFLLCAGQDPQHDYFKLVLQWPNSYCLTSRQPCRKQVPQYFTIDGLWPELFTGKEPQSCSSPQVLTNAIIVNLKYDLLKYWPDLSTYNFEDSRQLWKDQWDLHGSCASDILLPEDYFPTALNLRRSHNMYDILTISDIRADGRSYPAEDILHAISKVTKFMVNIVCKKDRMGNVYLLQIHLCIDSNATEFIDCQDQAMNCDEDTIIFPDQKYIPRNKGMDGPKCIKP